MAKEEKRLNEVPLTEIPEVAAFNEVQERYKAFRGSNPEFFKYLDQLAEEFNDKREAAEKATRSREVTCGDFHLYQFSTKYHPEALYQAMGHQRFLSLGGELHTQTIYQVDKARVEAAIKSGDIPKEVAEQVRTRDPRYHKPNKLELP